ncbi:hypothetical protein DAPPUDRAFT_226262 [Daphnia pulex]|uniref:Endonuclease/exonuclease/phosphatase domain-containing protein n=1 Tax=Daphnia pulex TaxID=6669 RepID=E9GXV1_DAPPU|nr:hypothetical protein DAPPUDRAFT_226262 [Daphnia pulex]|eukprot:EFX75753.1 hypothetical protein DAPPUDRAFT_226262 [Daphnia pulex]
MGGRLRKDGQPDMRYKSNRESASSNNVARKSAVTSETFTSSDDDSYDRNAPGPLRKDGQPNMRYAVNRKYVAERDANKVAENDRYDRNAPGPLRKDGQPNMRYAVNKKYVAEKEANKVAGNKITPDWNAPGPLRKDGQPNMRYTVNKKYVAEREANKVAENKKTAEEANKTGMVVTGKVKFGLVNAQSLRKKIRIVTIYRPPGNSKVDFLQDFEGMLEASNEDKRIFTGDFNLHVENPDKNDRDFLDLIKSHRLVQHVKESTHRKEGILDLILSRPSDRLVKNVRVGNDFSDHKSVECTISIEMKKEEIIQREE